MASGQAARLPAFIAVEGHGLQLREWSQDDIPAMVRIFDDPEVDRWTPLPFPFDAAAAKAYLERGTLARLAGAGIHLAITTDGREPVGEVLLYRVGPDHRQAELAYVVGREHRRQRLAVRAVGLMTSYACEHLAAQRVILRIAARNEASTAVAVAAGFRLTDETPVTRARKGQTVTLFTWVHAGAAADPG